MSNCKLGFWVFLEKLCFLKKNNSFKPESKGSTKDHDPVAIFVTNTRKKSDIMTSMLMHEDSDFLHRQHCVVVKS